MYLHALENGRQPSRVPIGVHDLAGLLVFEELLVVSPSPMARDEICQILLSSRAILQCTKISFISYAYFLSLCSCFLCVLPTSEDVGCVFLTLFSFQGSIPQAKKTRGILDLTSLEKSW